MFLIFWWTLFYAFELAVTSLGMQEFFLRIQYLAIPFIPVALFFFILDYAGYYTYLNRKFFAVLISVPVAALILLLTNSYHHLFFIKEYLVVVDGIFIRGCYPGPGYLIFAIYSGVLLFASAAILVNLHLTSQGIQKIQSTILMGALFAPLIVMVLYYFGITPYPYLDFTAIILPISGICVMIGLFKYSFFDIVPLPKEVLFSSLSEGIIVIDDKDRIIDTNQSAQKILGEEILADGSDLFDKETFLNDFREEIGYKKSIAFLANVDEEEEDKYYAVTITVVPVQPEDPLYRIIVLRDMTSEKKYETELKKSKNSLRIANKKIGLLNSITRHDILNNITILSGYTAMLEDGIPPESEEGVYLEKMSTAIEAITRQISFTADYQNMGVDDPVWQEVEPVTADAWNSLGLLKSDVEFEVDLPRMEVYADMLLSKVFYNLFENSIRHGEKVTKISVSFEITEDGSGVITVSDDGVGIPADAKDRIFTKGYGKNTGLGLFLVSEILSITGIGISETGAEGEGARFEILIHRNGWRLQGGK